MSNETKEAQTQGNYGPIAPTDAKELINLLRRVYAAPEAEGADVIGLAVAYAYRAVGYHCPACGQYTRVLLELRPKDRQPAFIMVYQGGKPLALPTVLARIWDATLPLRAAVLTPTPTGAVRLIGVNGRSWCTDCADKFTRSVLPVNAVLVDEEALPGSLQLALAPPRAAGEPYHHHACFECQADEGEVRR